MANATLTRVYAARLAYTGPDRADIRPGTTDPVGRLFAVPVELEGCGRRLTSDKSWDARREQYIARLRTSYNVHRAAWLALRERTEITFVCDCMMPSWCCAGVAAEILVRALPGLAELRGERELQRPLALGGGAR